MPEPASWKGMITMRRRVANDPAQTYPEGTAVELSQDYDMTFGYEPKIVVPAGSTGVVAEVGPGFVAVQLDHPVAGLEDWNNQLVFQDSDDTLEDYLMYIRPSTKNRFSSSRRRRPVASSRRSSLRRRADTTMVDEYADQLFGLEEDLAEIYSDLDKYIKYEWRIYNDVGEYGPDDLDAWARFIRKLKRANALVAQQIERAEANLNEQASLIKRHGF